jgi:hypothetical protein
MQDGAFSLHFPSFFLLSVPYLPLSVAESFIPTTDAIARAKARREELRKSGAAVPPAGSDYVSLDVGFASKGGDSRLVREEDEIGDGDEGAFAYPFQLSLLPTHNFSNAQISPPTPTLSPPSPSAKRPTKPQR